MVGGVIRWFVDNKKNTTVIKREKMDRGQRCPFYAAGMIAGEGVSLVSFLLY